jgi:8-hydroxy-5-deazaflavin:NADPH oxidoreductase
MRIGFLGGTGAEGKGLALRFAAAGADVILGSRSEERAQAKAAEYNVILGRPAIQGLANSGMIAASEIVFLTVPFEQAVPAIEACRDSFLPGVVLVDVTVPTRFVGGQVEYLEMEEGSNAERIAGHVPHGVELVGAFKTIPAHVLSALDQELRCDLFVCGDSREAREKVMEAARLIPSLRPLDAGPLRNARALERMTILAIHLNRRYRSKGARYGIVGI